MKKRIIAYSLCIQFILSMTAYCESGKSKIIYRFPSLYNTNPVSGRLYLQPIGIHEDQVVSGTLIDFSFDSSSEYNRYFKPDSEVGGDDCLTLNTNTYSLKISEGFMVHGYGMEIGGIFRVHQDKKETLLSKFLRNFHDWSADKLGFNGHSPPKGQYYGAIGDNDTIVIGESGEIYLSTLQLYSKIQLLKDGGVSSFRPNVSMKFSARIPISHKDFDQPGISVSAGISKKVLSSLSIIGAADIIYQDLESEDFNASNLDVEKLVSDLFAGFIWDMGDAGGWYNSIGMRYSTVRVKYKTNPNSADDAYVLHYGLVYQRKLKKGRIMDFYMNMNEDFPQFGRGLEPDFRIQVGVSLNL